VVTALTKAISLGTQGANGTSNGSNLQSIAVQVQGILDTVVSQANLSYQGAYLFGGTATNQIPYTADPTSPSGYMYNGNNNANLVPVGERLNVQLSLPGSQIFSDATSNVLGSLTSLIAALQGGSTSAIASATTSVTSALNFVSQQRVVYGNAEAQLTAQDSFLQNETVTLSSQANTLVGIDLAKAATTLSQAETNNNATLAAAAKVLPNTLLNYLSNPG
jgi:flagellar hook-associated protein 3 FlgL